MTGKNLGSLKFLLIIIGMILAIIGIVINNWKLAAIGDTVAIAGALFT